MGAVKANNYFRPAALIALYDRNVFALVAHIAEAGYAWKLATDFGLSKESRKKWLIQTFILGFPSLKILRSYRRSRRN
uniref:Transmembrane protein 254 n=1 Tax=Plectus sambesii TaxID=2011161 RepID=A0A914UGL8_9BILA